MIIVAIRRSFKIILVTGILSENCVVLIEMLFLYRHERLTEDKWAGYGNSISLIEKFS